MMTGIELLPTRVLGTAWPQHFNKADRGDDLGEHPESRAAHLDRRRSDARQALQKELRNQRSGSRRRSSWRQLQGPVTDNTGGGSDDIGDISWNVPTVTLRYPANIPGLPGHNWANAIAMATPIAHKGVIAGAKVQAMTCST